MRCKDCGSSLSIRLKIFVQYSRRRVSQWEEGLLQGAFLGGKDSSHRDFSVRNACIPLYSGCICMCMHCGLACMFFCMHVWHVFLRGSAQYIVGVIINSMLIVMEMMRFVLLFPTQWKWARKRRNPGKNVRGFDSRPLKEIKSTAVQVKLCCI